MTRSWLPFCLLLSCTHAGTLRTPSSNAVVLNPSGIPAFPGQVSRCPGNNADGEILKTWPSGKKQLKGTCKGGLMVGPWKAYFENGAVEWDVDFDAGVMSGPYKAFYANDQKRAVVTFKAGFPEGDFKGWHFNGQVSMKGEYVGGKPNGCWETWHDNGQKASKGTYQDGVKVVTWLYWTADGSKRKEMLGGTPTHGECLITL